MAIRIEGSAKGKPCRFPAGENGYCGKHQRNKLYDEGISEGKIWCRQFFRGCSNTVTKENTSCNACKEAIRGDKSRCAHDGCSSSAKQEEKYCGKHARDKYRDQEKEENIRYCDIARGCFRLCEEGKASCSQCLEKVRTYDNSHYASLKEIHKSINTVNGVHTPSLQVCCYCGKDFSPFTTKHGKVSQACQKCNETQHLQDLRRRDRTINYAERKAHNSELHYAEYIRSASKRNLTFELSFDQFKELVSKACFYCGIYKPGESNGIDRLNNDEGYTTSNSRPCCDICNRIKWTFHPIFIIDKCCLIAGKLVDKDEFYTKWSCYYQRSSPPAYAIYANSANQRGYEFKITREEFADIIKSPCYICEYSGVTGVDRIDNKLGYTRENCRSCCYSCNISKCEFDYSTIIEKAYMISSLWTDTTAITVPLPLSHSLKSDKPRKSWKASSLYIAIIRADYSTIMETLYGIKNIEELQNMRTLLITKTYAESEVILKRFLNTVKGRRLRAIADGATITHA